MNELGQRVVGIAGLCLVLLIAWLPLPLRATPAPEEMVSLVEQHIEWFFAKAPAGKSAALELAPMVTEIALEHSVDPLLVAVLVGCESSWRTKVAGSVGERGLLQVHGDAAIGYDLTKPREQLNAGVTRLLAARAACGEELVNVLAHYQAGSCKPIAAARYRANLYAEAWERLELSGNPTPFHF